jgi:hypothetical protein
MAYRGNAVEETYMAWNDWDGSEKDIQLFDAVEFQIHTLTGGPFTPVRYSKQGANADPCIVYDQMGNEITSITSAQIGMMLTGDGRSLFKLSGTGTITASIRAA